MPILTTPQGRKLYVLRRISTGEIIKRNTPYPTMEDDSPIAGFDPDLEFLAMDQDTQPDYDPRLYALSQAETRENADPRPVWRIRWSTAKVPLSQAKQNAANIEAARAHDHYTVQERDKVLLLATAVLFRQVANQQLTAKEVALKQRIIELATKLWKNDARLAAIFAALDAGQDPDLDAGWEPAA